MSYLVDHLSDWWWEVHVDAVLAAVVQAAPSLGVTGVLVTLIWILLKREARVDTSHADALDRQARLHTAELGRLNRDHDAELLELGDRIRELRHANDELYDHLARERSARLDLPPRNEPRRTRHRSEEAS